MLATLSFFNLGVLEKYRCNPTPVTVLSIETPMEVVFAYSYDHEHPFLSS